jgi:hypothetical protein
MERFKKDYEEKTALAEETPRIKYESEAFKKAREACIREGIENAIRA